MGRFSLTGPRLIFVKYPCCTQSPGLRLFRVEHSTFKVHMARDYFDYNLRRPVPCLGLRHNCSGLDGLSGEVHEIFSLKKRTPCITTTTAITLLTWNVRTIFSHQMYLKCVNITSYVFDMFTLKKILPLTVSFLFFYHAVIYCYLLYFYY